MLPGAHRIDLLDQAIYHAYLARPSQFADQFRAVRPGTTVVVDEVPRIPALLNEVHRFMEERRMCFVLCGSSTRERQTLAVSSASEVIPCSIA